MKVYDDWVPLTDDVCELSKDPYIVKVVLPWLKDEMERNGVEYDESIALEAIQKTFFIRRQVRE